ncbi:MAG: hypothetical protein J0L53_06365 [Spirochaetes bacterium]|nr:hypothetical protein [Spirochaetota bacterium]
MKLLSLCGILPLAAMALSADEFKSFKHPKPKFSVSYPADWKLSPVKEGMPFMASAPDDTANVQVRTDAVRGKTSACEYLAKTEAGAEGGRSNLIPEDKRKVTAAQLQYMGVKEGCLAAYKIMVGKDEVLQGTGVYISGKNVWVVIQTLQTAARERHAKGVSDIAKSFTTK